jgi:hypothetical protein
MSSLIRVTLPLALLLTVTSLAAAQEGTANCRKTLKDQAAAWNKGDITRFLQGYRQSPHTVFSSKSNTSVGFASMAARYRKRYPNKKVMGRLTFSELTFKALSGDEVLTQGRWHLQRESPKGGRFVLIMRQEKKNCLVTLDYTTVD